MENKNNSVKIIAIVGTVCLVAGTLLGILIMKAFFMPGTIILEDSLQNPYSTLDPAKTPEPIVTDAPVDLQNGLDDSNIGVNEPENGIGDNQSVLAKIPLWEKTEYYDSEITTSFSTTYVATDPNSPMADFDNLADYIPDEGTYRVTVDDCVVYMTVQDVNFNPYTVTDGIYSRVYITLSQYSGTELLAEDDGYICDLSVSSELPLGSFTIGTGSTIYSDNYNFYLDRWTGPVFTKIDSSIYRKEEIMEDLEQLIEILDFIQH